MRRARGCAASIARGRVARAGDLKSLCSPGGHERSHDVCSARGARHPARPGEATARVTMMKIILFVPVVRSRWRC